MINMKSKNYKHWLSLEDDRPCKDCEDLHGKIYEMAQEPDPLPHQRCRCIVVPMDAVAAGQATERGRNGADWWIVSYGDLPPYYISPEEAMEAGWNPRRNRLSSFVPNMMLSGGEYKNENGHLPQAEGRAWFEADLNYQTGKREKDRIVYSSDGLVFVSSVMTIIRLL